MYLQKQVVQKTQSLKQVKEIQFQFDKYNFYKKNQEMQKTLLKQWGLQHLIMIKQLRKQNQSEPNLEYSNPFSEKKPIVKLPLQFTYPPVEIISKQLTKLNSKYKQRIIYLGPRWSDSVSWHKKYSKASNHFDKINSSQEQQQNKILKLQQAQLSQTNFNGYYFNERRVVRNNNFLQDSMKENKFFKNQVYYRAFQGMNPTLNQTEQIFFQSRFQSGNLDCVVKINENQYDLFLRIDTNTRGNLFWYYFKVWLPKTSKNKKQKVKFNICNISKSKTLYQKNLKPYVKIRKNNQSKGNKDTISRNQWSQGVGISNCNFKQKKLRYEFIYEKIKPPILYQLSFELELTRNQQVELAYCIPYTYTRLMNQLVLLEKEVTLKKSNNVFISKLGQSLTGVQIPIIVIGDIKNIQNSEEQKVVFITGRVHPGESNSSLILSSLINQLCLKKQDKTFAGKIIFIIVPMLNPDGVIFGNGRCSALGRDLNRQFKSWNSALNPEVVAIKKLIDKIQQTHQIQIYFDFHGHSKKKNVFFFGPHYSVTDPNYYRCRVFPKIFSKNLDFFRYFGCSYGISQSKKTTARAIMINQFGIQFFYTVEASIGFYHDYLKRQDAPFTNQSLFKIGLKFKQSLKQYFQGIQEYQQFLKSRKREKTQKGESNTLSIQSKNLNQKQISFQLKQINFNQDIQKPISGLKYMKVFEQIKTEAKILQKSKKQDVDSSSDSDSCRAEQQLEVEKLKQFSQMLLVLNRIEQQKIQNHTSKRKGHLPNQSEQQRLKLLHQKKKQKKHKSLLNGQLSSLIKKLTTKSQFRVHQNNIKLEVQQSTSNYSKSLKSKQLSSHQLFQNQKTLIVQEPIAKKPTLIQKKNLDHLNVSVHNFFRKNQLQFGLQDHQTFGIVNFSKMIQNPKSLRYSQNDSSKRAKMHSRSQRKKYTNLQEENRKSPNHLLKNFEPFFQQKDIFLNQIGQNLGKQQTNYVKPYPASFYRIKYQTSHKKYRERSPQRTFSNFKKIYEQKVGSMKNQGTIKQPQRLFINISRIQS